MVALSSLLERFRHGAIVLFDERQHINDQLIDGDEAAMLEQFACQDPERNLDLVHQRSMFGSVAENNAMGRFVQNRGLALHRHEDAPPILTPTSVTISDSSATQRTRDSE